MCEIQRFLNLLSGETELQLMFCAKENFSLDRWQIQTKGLIKECFFATEKISKRLASAVGASEENFEYCRSTMAFKYYALLVYRKYQVC